jgi:N-acetylmuramoyl-L-alanine amidase
MSSKIYISPSNQEANLYATGGTNEKEQCHKIARACYNYLKNKGFNVKCTYNDNMYERVKESNVFGADIHLAIHTNATSKHNVTGGTQILLYSLTGERKKVGEAVFNRLSPITPGKSAEKLIEKPSFYEINSAKGITVYCECEFHDTQEGSDFIIKNTKIIGETIAKGICDYYGVNTVEEKTTSENKKTLYTVQVGAFSSKNNAIKYAEKIKKAGFDAIVVSK